MSSNSPYEHEEEPEDEHMSDNSDNSEDDEFHSFSNEDDDDDYEENDVDEMDYESNLASVILPHILPGSNLHELIYAIHRQNRRREQPPEYNYPVPSPTGAELMRSGDFGLEATEQLGEERKFQYNRRKSISHRLLNRELGLGGYTRQRMQLQNSLMAQDLLPTSKADFIIHSDNRCYSGQFSDDGNFFYLCAQDFRVRIYDTSNPYKWKYVKSLEYWGGRWTITDATHSPDGRFLAYSSISSRVCLSSTQKDIDETHYLDFKSAGIWSIRFSGDGRELIAGTQVERLGEKCIVIYDIEKHQPILKLAGHANDVNAVCYGDKNSPHILYSGSDDTTVKVWDRRSMADGREVGIFTGHLEGVTYIDSKGDGRYVLSNGKDQTMKLWDIRNMMDTDEFDHLRIKNYSSPEFDYREGVYSDVSRQHPQDRSLVTFRGHKVLYTLIRCHFSPEISTGGRYVYTGSSDGQVKIYNLDATEAGTVDVCKATKNEVMGDDDGYGADFFYGRRRMTTCVRDVSWHPSAPVLAATSWAGGYGRGVVSVHTWGGPKEREKKDEGEFMKGKDKDSTESDEEEGEGEETRNYTVELKDIWMEDDLEDEDVSFRRRMRRH